MAKSKKSASTSASSGHGAATRRAPLTRERVLRAAMALADAEGLDALTMRRVGEQVGVEAMSLYKHVASKDDILDGILELVVLEMAFPSGAGWRAALRARAASAREVLLRHRWAALLLESRITPSPARLRLNENVLRVLRTSGFSTELAYSAFLTLDSYIYGFTLQEVSWPFEPEERSDVVETLSPHISPADYPHLTEVMAFILERGSRHSRRGKRGDSSRTGYAADFDFGLELVLDGLARARRRSAGNEK